MKKDVGYIFVVMLISIIMLSGKAFSQSGTTTSDFKKAGGSGSQFLKIGVGSRAMGMGGAFGSVADDITATYWNPAGIASIEGINFTAQHTTWFADMAHEFFAFTFQPTDRFTVGISTTYFDAGSMDITTIEQPEGTGGKFSVNDMAIGVTVAAVLSDQLSFGITGKFVQNNIYDLSATGFAVDAGTIYQSGFNNLRVGLAITNFGGEMTFEGQSLTVGYQNATGNRPIESQLMNQPFSLPLAFRAGISIEPISGIEGQKFTVAADFVHLTDNPEKVNLGGEYVWNDLLAVRGGYIVNTDEAGLNVGGGVQYNTGSFRGSVDYAWSDFGRLGNIHRFGVALKF